MTDAQLNTATNSGQQSTTQSPQSAGQPALSAAAAGNLQPGTNSGLLSGGRSIPLNDQAVTTLQLAPKDSAKTSQDAPAGYHFNPLLILIIALLLAAAAASMLLISRSAK